MSMRAGHRTPPERLLRLDLSEDAGQVVDQPTVTHVTFDPSKRFHHRYPVDVIRDCLDFAISDA
jgi:hypothetical protein